MSIPRSSRNFVVSEKILEERQPQGTNITETVIYDRLTSDHNGS